MSQLKSIKDLKHKVVVIFYQEEEQVEELAVDLDFCLPGDVDFVICDNIDDAHLAMLTPDALMKEERF